MQFIADGCDNCTQLNLKNDKERVSESTTPSYSGYVTTSQLSASIDAPKYCVAIE
ncbi:MAG: hypothetical protein CMB57_05365 [Euryarchaeota archaeon]|nr:hypothetical protein [Euryarchaeota archaeon]